MKNENKFIFIDDKWNYILVENIEYYDFIREFNLLDSDIKELWWEYWFFYDELENRLRNKYSIDVTIWWIDCQELTK